MKRLGNLAKELGWATEELAGMPADEVEQLMVVSETFRDWLSEMQNREFQRNQHGQNHA